VIYSVFNISNKNFIKLSNNAFSSVNRSQI